MKRLISLFTALVLSVSACCYAITTPAEQAELMEIILELEKINTEQKTTLDEQETTLNQQQETLNQQETIINEQETIIENLQKDATEQKTLLKEQKKSYRLTTWISSLITALISFIFGAWLC